MYSCPSMFAMEKYGYCKTGQRRKWLKSSYEEAFLRRILFWGWCRTREGGLRDLGVGEVIYRLHMPTFGTWWWLHSDYYDKEEIKNMDTLGQILWFAMFGTPLLTIPLTWRMRGTKKNYRVIVGLFLALALSFFLYHISLAIIFRDGMGPSWQKD